MKFKYYMIGLAALYLCTACNNNDEPEDIQSGKEKIVFSAALQHTEAVSSRADDPLLRYVNGIYLQKNNETQINYEIRNGNYGTLDPVTTGSYLKWTEEERNSDSEVHFYGWTTPTGVTITPEQGIAKGTIDFSSADDGGNRLSSKGGDQNIYDKSEVTPLEVFISTHQTGQFKDKPNILLPFKHQVCKVWLEIYDDKNFCRTTNAIIKFPFIKQIWTIAQEKAGGNLGDFNYTAEETSNALTLDLNTVDQSGNKALFYLPPMEGNNSFEKIGDFEITYDGKIYYGSFAALIKELKRGEVMTCRIDLNENYGTGIGVRIEPWTSSGNLEAPANPYQGIYTVDDLKVLKSYLTNTIQTLPEHLYINESGKKIIRLYNDLTLSDEEWSLILEQDMIFDGLGHIVTVPSGKSLFGEITATGVEGVEINNIRLAGEGQLATSLTNVKVYNCHANGSRDLIGEAKNNTIFDFCSAETASNKLANITSGTVTMQNSFVAYADAAEFAGGTIAKNSFIFDTTINEGTYYDSTGQKETNKITVDSKTGRLVIINALQNPEKIDELIDLLNAASNTLNHTASQKYWVYVYGKTYPVMRIK